MDYDKLIDAVKLCGSTPKIDQCKQCAYWSDGDMGKCIPKMTGDAATALSMLQAENAQLRGELEYEKEHANAYHEECGQWEAENEKLRAELNDLKSKWDKYQPREHWETLNELCENLHDELEKVKAERDAALEHLHGICSACKNYSPYHNRGKCRFCAYEPARDKDAEANDNWEWRGQKED